MIKLKIWQIIMGICYLITIPRLHYMLNNLNERNVALIDCVILIMWAFIGTAIVMSILMSEKVRDFLDKEIKI